MFLLNIYVFIFTTLTRKKEDRSVCSVIDNQSGIQLKYTWDSYKRIEYL